MLRLAPIALLVPCLASCLPTSLTDAEVAARIADATPHDVASADASGADTGLAICGNKVAEDKEACDDGDGDQCNGCDACELRRVLHVTDGNQFAMASSPSFEFFTNGTLKSKGDQFSVGVWLKLAELPPVGKPAPLFALGTDKANPIVAISTFTNEGKAFAACTLRSTGPPPCWQWRARTVHSPTSIVCARSWRRAPRCRQRHRANHFGSLRGPIAASYAQLQVH